MMPQFMSASSDGSRLIKSPQAAKKQPIEKDKNFGKKNTFFRGFLVFQHEEK